MITFMILIVLIPSLFFRILGPRWTGMTIWYFGLYGLFKWITGITLGEGTLFLGSVIFIATMEIITVIVND